MRKPSHPRGPTSSPEGDNSPITKENFAQRAMEFGAAHGSFFVLRRHRADQQPATPAQWRAWLIYLKSKYISTNFMEARGVYQVPAEWPEGFDSESRDSDRTAVDPLEPPIRPSERAAVLDGLQRLARSLESRPDPRRPNNPVHRSPLEILAEAEARAKTLPAPRLSAESLAKLGLVDRPGPEHGELDAWITEEAF